MSETPPIDKRRSKRWLVVILLLICVSVGGTWFYARQSAYTQVQNQLDNLGMGTAQIGNVEIGPSGVTANEIQFQADAGSQPWLKIEKMSIEHPIFGLAAGDAVYDAIIIDGLETTVDLDQANDRGSFELKDFFIPAKTARITGSKVTFTQADHAELSVELKEATVEATEKGYRVQGSVIDPSGSSWETTGSVSPASNRWNLELKTDSTQLTDDRWQRWPMLPTSLREYIEAEVTFGATVILGGDTNQPLSYQADIALQSGMLRLPVFDLPVRVQKGNLVVSDGLVRFQDVIATADEQGELVVSGSTTIVGFPIATTFEIDFRDVEVATIDKLVSDIPDVVGGRFDGSVEGRVEVDGNLQTTLALQGAGSSRKSSYADIHSNNVSTVVQIDELVLDPNASVESIAGKVIVKANVEDVSANNVFDSLELRDLASQLEIDISASGEFFLDLPLNSAGDLATWTMKVNANAEQGTISQQPLHKIATQVDLENGDLKFTQITAYADATLKEPLQATLDWPLLVDEDHVEEGTFAIGGQRVAPKWLLGLIDRQVGNASVDDNNVEDKPSLNASLGNAFDAIRGAVDFETQFNLPTAAPEKLSRWRVTGKVANSKVIAGDYELDRFAMLVNLDRGTLTVSDAAGGFAGEGDGQLAGGGQLNLETGQVENANLKGVRVPLRWLAVVGSRLSPDFQSFMAANGLGAASPEADLDGNLSVRFQLLDPTDADSDHWAFSTQVEAKELMVKGTLLNNLRIEGRVDESHIVITDSRVDLPKQGSVNLDGSWGIADQNGNANLTWRRLPVSTLSAFGVKGIASVGGTTTGQLQLGSTRQPGAIDHVPNLALNGTISLDDLRIGGVRSRRVGFDLHTENGELLLDNFRTAGDVQGVDVMGRLTLAEPFDFRLNASLKKIPLSKVMAQRSVVERFGGTQAISGVADGQVRLEGDLKTLHWETLGDLSVTSLGVDGKMLNDIKAQWNYDPTNFDESSLAINAFGGLVEVVEYGDAEGRVKFQLSRVDAGELTSLAKLPFRLEGKIAGDASLYQWGSGKSTWADFHLKGLSAMVGGTEVGDLAANLEFRDSQAKYSIEGRLLNGKIVSEGETKVDLVDLSSVEFPLSVRFTNGSLNDLYKSSNRLSSLRPLQGKLSAKAEVVLSTSRPPTAQGFIRVNDLTWNGERLTREISSSASLNKGILELNKLRADLNRGELSGRASFPISGNGNGTYQLDVRQFDLQRFLEIVMTDPIDGVGFMDARVSGKIGRTVNGQGSLAINQAKLLGLAGRTFNVPIRFQFEPGRQTGKFEIRESKFQMLKGNVAGHATIDFGRTFNLESDFQVSKIDTEQLFSGLMGFGSAGQGELSGRLIAKGNSIRSLKDLKGSFTGKLDRVEAFKLPLLDTLSRFVGGNALQSRDFESNDIDVRMNGGKVEFKRLNLNNSLAQISITGNVFSDGRLDLDISARVDQLNQPSLIDQLAGSPLSRFAGSPAGFFAQAANFLSERLVFVRVGGTIKRPQLRADAGKQLKAETIRYFLRGSQILPNNDSQDN